MQARRATLVFATNVVGGLAGLIILFFVGRFMSPAAYGAFGFALSYLGLWMVLADLGLEQAHVRHVTHGTPIGAAVGTFRGLKLGVLAVFVLTTGLWVWLWSRSGSLTDASGLFVLVVVLAHGAFFILRTIPAGTLNALRLSATVQVVVLVEHVVRLPLTVVAALFFGFMTDARVPWPEAAQFVADHSPFHRPMTGDEGGLLLALALAAAMFASLVVAVTLERRQALPAARFDRALARAYVAFAVPVALGASTRIIFANIDAVFVGFFLAAENVGYYFASDRLTAIIYMVPVALHGVFFPVFGELAAKRDLPVLLSLARNLQRFTSLVMVLAAVLFVVFAAEGIKIFLGDPFLPARPIVALLSVYVVFLALSMIPISLILLLGDPYTVVRVGLLGLAMNAVLNLLLIPDSVLGIRLAGWHSVGAAASTAASQLVSLVLLLFAARRAAGGSLLGASNVKHVGSGGVTALVLLAAAPTIFGHAVRVWELMVAAALGTGVYLAVLVAIGEITRTDVAIVRDAAHPRRLVAYLRAELRDRRGAS